MDIKNVKVTVEREYASNEGDGRSHYEYKLRLEIPLPGGKAIYEIPITKGHYKSLETAAKLSEVVSVPETKGDDE